jgi:hypothetical protein
MLLRCVGSRRRGIYVSMRKNIVRFSVVLGAAITAGSAQAGLVSQWQFEFNLNDSVGPNNGTSIASIGYAPGVSGQALSLVGAGGVDIANPVAGGLQSASGFTVSAWIKMVATSSGPATGSILNLRTVGGTTGFSLEETFGVADSLSLYVNTSGTTTYNQVALGGWVFNQAYYVAASFDAASHTMKLYRNGVLQASLTTATGTTMTTDPLSAFQIGRNIVNGSEWNGLIDDARFYNTALSDAQVAALVPEPTSILAMVAGLSLMLRSRRSR